MGEPPPGHEVTPVQDVRVGSFELDAYEVTLARFNAFWTVRDRDLPAIRSAPIEYPGGRVVSWTGTGEEPTPEDTRFNWSSGPGPREGHPMNGVDWWAAQEFCVWDGGRLPTEAEWEFAARGRTVEGLTTPRAYPWGNSAPRGNDRSVCDRAQWILRGEDGASTRRVGRFAPVAGLYDMTGNVWEWTADWFAPTRRRRVGTGRPAESDVYRSHDGRAHHPRRRLGLRQHRSALDHAHGRHLAHPLHGHRDSLRPDSSLRREGVTAEPGLKRATPSNRFPSASTHVVDSGQ
ncbi:MAG: SUMF1/EgtB/PvdO family nonheme iron enzyme [Deltaproteobacteria bacterium]|nr:SUMF1/EgtB/PvdO family nonheme iron enzyme [Deltaproteobacteria bacterium]